jgi:hypothetical protein
MSQGMRDMLANKKFAIPLIILLGFCLVGLILVGVVLLLRPGADDTRGAVEVAGQAVTPSVTAFELATFTPAVTNTPASTSTPTPRATATLVLVPTLAGGTGATPLATADVGTGTGTEGMEATSSPVPQAAATAAPANSDGELAQTGLGWGLILFSGAGLAALVIVARRLRLSAG